MNRDDVEMSVVDLCLLVVGAIKYLLSYLREYLEGSI